MQIKELMEKAEQGKFSIFSLLSRTAKPISLKNVMERTHLSKSTVLKYTDSLNDFFKSKEFAIRIEVDRDSLYLNQGDNRYWKSIRFSCLEGGIKYQILVYLFKNQRFTIQSLSRDLLVSEATLNRHLAQLNQLLKDFQITITNGRLRGSEILIRHFYFELFWESWDKTYFEKQIRSMNYQTEIHMLEGLCQVSLNEHQLEKWLLWIFISLNRLGTKEKDFVDLEKSMQAYLKNIFYQRLHQLALRYFSQYAVEFEDGEAMCLFVFLATRFVLPKHTMAYLLGFGGPVVAYLTDAIQLIRQWGGFVDDLSEEVTYHLSQWFGRAYFYKGVVLSSDESSLIRNSPYAYLLTDDILNISQKIVSLIGDDKVLEDFRTKMLWGTLQILLFIAQRKQDYITIGVDIADGELKSDLVIQLLKHYLENNQFYQLEHYNNEKTYDYIISNQTKVDYKGQATYYLNRDLSMKDIEEIVKLLKG